MKKINLKLTIFTILLASLFVLNSCDKCDDPDPNDNPLLKEVAADNITTLENIDLLISPDITLSSLENEFTIIADGIPDNKDLDNEEYRIGRKGYTKKNVYDFLRLTERQKAQLKTAMMQYNRCRKQQYMQLKRITMGILIKANAERMKLIRQYKAGQLTKRQLYDALNKLNQRIKNAIKTNPQRIQIINNIKRCRQAYITNLQNILTREQWQIWVKWHKQGSKHNGGKGDGPK